MTERARRILAIIGFAFLVAISYADPLLLRRSFAGRDLIAYNLPMEKTIHDAYARGVLPVWMPYVSGGRPLLPNPNAGALYPLRIFLSLVPFPLEMRLFPILHWVLAGLGMQFLLAEIGTSAAASWIAAVSYVFSGVVVSEVFFPHIQPGMALLPWFIWAVQHRFRRAGIRVIVLSLLFGLDMLAGDVFTVGLAMLCALLWIGLERGSEHQVRLAAGVFAAFGLGILLALPQILATTLWIPETNRAVLGLKLGETLHYSVTPWRLLEFFIPYPFGPTWDLNDSNLWTWLVFREKLAGLFLTLYAGAFSVIALTVCARRHAMGRRFALVLLTIALVVSMAPSLLPARWEMLSSPLALRNPEKVVVAASLALAVLSGLAVDCLRELPRTPRWVLTLGGGLAVSAAAARLWPAQTGRAAVALTGAGSQYAAAASSSLPRSLSEAGLLWMATVLAIELFRTGRGTRRVVSVLLLTAVPILANRRIAITFRDEEVFDTPPFVRFLEKRDPAGQYRTLGESMFRASGALDFAQTGQDFGFTEYARNNWSQHSHALWQRGTVFNGDFDSGDLSRVESLRRITRTAIRYRDSEEFFAALSLRFGIRYRDHVPIAGYRRIGGDSLRDWDELASAHPDIRLLSGWREEKSSLAALEALPGLGPGEIVIETESSRQGMARPGTVRVLVKQPELLSMETDSPDPAFLFVLRDFWNSRTVTLDRRSVDVYPAQLAFSAVSVPAGHHRIEWREEVPGLTISRFGPAAFLLIAVLLFVLGRNQKQLPGEAF